MMVKRHHEISVPLGLARFTKYSPEYALLNRAFNGIENRSVDLIQTNAGRISESGYRFQVTFFNQTIAVFRAEPIFGIRSDTVSIDDGVEMRFDGLGLGQQSAALSFILDTVVGA